MAQACCEYCVVELVRNLMAHAQKPHSVFRLNGRVHLNLRGSQFSRMLAAEVCASALVMLDTPRSKVVWEYWLPTPFTSFPFTSPPVRYRVPPHSEHSIHYARLSKRWTKCSEPWENNQEKKTDMGNLYKINSEGVLHVRKATVNTYRKQCSF